MNKVNRLIVGIFVLVSALVLSIASISAENLTTNETIVVNGTENEEAICEDELEMLMDLHNRLVEDYQAGENCGMAFAMVKDMNEVLAEERDSCREEIGEVKVYRVGFYVLLGVLVITSVIILFSAMKKE